MSWFGLAIVGLGAWLAWKASKDPRYKANPLWAPPGSRMTGAELQAGPGREQIIQDVALTLWQDAVYRRSEDARDEGLIPGEEARAFQGEVQFEVPSESVSDAREVVDAVEQHYGKGIWEVLEDLSYQDEFEVTDDEYEMFTYYLAMQALGHGVAWSDSNPGTLWTPIWDAKAWESSGAAWEALESWMEGEAVGYWTGEE